MDRIGMENMETRWLELRDIVNRWDPIGVYDFKKIDWPRDEYDCVVGSLMSMLRAGKTSEEITHYLERRVREHFGLEVAPGEAARCAEEAFLWFHGRRIH